MKIILWLLIGTICIASIYIGATQIRSTHDKNDANSQIPIYSRSDCTVLIDIKYHALQDETVIHKQYGEVADSIWKSSLYKSYPVASYGTPQGFFDQNYMIFTKDCDRKYEMVQDLVDIYHRDFPDGARLSVSHEIVLPHIETIAVQGPYWTDGFEDIGRGPLREKNPPDTATNPTNNH